MDLLLDGGAAYILIGAADGLASFRLHRKVDDGNLPFEEGKERRTA